MRKTKKLSKINSRNLRMHEISLALIDYNAGLLCNSLMPSTLNTRYEGQRHIFATAIIYWLRWIERDLPTYFSPRSSAPSLRWRRSTMILARGWKLITIEGNGWGNLDTADCLKWRMVPSGTPLKTFSDTYLDAPWCCNAVAVIVWDISIVAHLLFVQFSAVNMSLPTLDLF